MTPDPKSEYLLPILKRRISSICSQRLLAVLRSLSHKKTTTNGAAEARVLVFALYKKEATRVEQMLQRQGFAVGAIHGDMNQNARMDALERFKNGTTGLLVATDVAARGLDIPNVGAVVNYTFPLTIEDYIHRIGRTGKSICFSLADQRLTVYPPFLLSLLP